MCEILSTPDVDRTLWLFDILWSLPQSEQEKYENAEDELGSDDLEEVEQFMEDYFKEHGYIAS